MVKSLNGVGHLMGKKTIAECVEREDVLNKLREIGGRLRARLCAWTATPPR
jgi:hypothetical protein